MNIFNPEHDLCMANGDANFVPPYSALVFGRDCSGLTAWVDEASASEVIPWGWDAALKRRLRREGVPDVQLPSDEALAVIRRLSRRQMSMKASAFIGTYVRDPLLRPLSYVHELSGIAELVPLVDEFGDAVLKAPLSGSGKGLRWARRGELSASDIGWCRNVIAKQGALMLEKRLDIIQDFAMLFHVGEHVRFEGYSLFFNDNGTYKGNVLASDAHILSVLGGLVPGELILQVRKALSLFLNQEFLGLYNGYAGVDMFIYGEHDVGPGSGNVRYRLAPCVEINVRMTMGLLARRLFDRHLFYHGDRPVLHLHCPGHCPDEVPASFRPDMDGRLVMSVEFSPAGGGLYSRKDEFLGSLTGVTPASRYAVVVRSRTC